MKEIIYNLNSDLSSDLEKMQKRVSDPTALALVTRLIHKLTNRNKLIIIADSSPAGWTTVREYESGDLASTFERCKTHAPGGDPRPTDNKKEVLCTTLPKTSYYCIQLQKHGFVCSFSFLYNFNCSTVFTAIQCGLWSKKQFA